MLSLSLNETFRVSLNETFPSFLDLCFCFSEFGLAGDLKECVKKVTASVAMVHSIPELRVSEQVN